ncbi:tight adherence protein B [Paenibacillus phyllosphaerae]|uniref:Tight adherence protein B n=1 Tax=Paenibacillus phyllosphaerae TaxID=274593 RepID=A0A7W5B2B4_9BACL|nr:type II secretion system F family protein [Paenibacillus phyllosphaerae]MBB3112922.1 tight adherence protein B [Paenibacillus phyllosphaerae]
MKQRQQKLPELLTWLGWPGPVIRDKQAELPVYTSLTLIPAQFIRAAAVGGMLIAMAAYLFYHSFAMAVLAAVAGLIAPRRYRDALLQSKRTRLTLQFKEALYSLTASLAAGRSVENAFLAARDDLQLLYPDPAAEIRVEFEIIHARLAYGEPLEHILVDFAERAAIEDISQFVDVFVICKRTGGDLVEVIRRTSQTIGEKLDVQQEIAVMVAQKRFEGRIMMAVPFVFMAFLSYAAPDYMEPLYSGIGYVILTGALILLALCYWLMARIMRIQV